MAGRGLDVYSYQEAIEARIREIIPNTTIYLDSVPEDGDLDLNDQQKVIPFVVLRFGPTDADPSTRSFRGARYDGYYASFDIITVGPDGKISRRLNSALMSHIIGFKPDGVAPVHQRQDMGRPAIFTVSQNEVRPTYFITTTRYRYTVNATAIGEAAEIPA